MKDELEDNGTADRNIIKSVVKVAAVVDLLDEHGALSLTELCQLAKMGASSMFRILATLKEIRYVVQNPVTQKYSNSPKLFMLGRGVLQRINFNPLLTIQLQKLAEQTGVSVNVGMADGKYTAYLAGCAAKGTIQLDDNVGSRAPLYCTGIGKAILACYRPEYVAELCKEFDFRKHTENTLSSQEALLAELVQVREQGYAVDNMEWDPMLYCTAIALLDAKGFPVVGVSLTAPSFLAREDAGLRERCARALLEAADELTAAIMG